MMRRIKLLSDNVLKIKCQRCGGLLLLDYKERIARRGCDWDRIADADLRTPPRLPSEKMSQDAELLCKKCLADPGIDFSVLTDEQLKFFERTMSKLLGFEIDVKVNAERMWAVLFKLYK
jgi:hypothetical protein